MSKITKREIGSFGERCAAKFLIKNGYEIVNQNYYTQYGEIDLIAENDKYIAFVEVKTRHINPLVRPVYAVNKAKQNKMIKTAFLYLQEHKSIKQPRFDVIEVLYDPDNVKSVLIRHIPNAFIQEGDYAPF